MSILICDALAKQIVDAIYADADDRRGVLDDIDAEMRKEIRKAWHKIVAGILDSSGWGPPRRVEYNTRYVNGEAPIIFCNTADGLLVVPFIQEFRKARNNCMLAQFVFGDDAVLFHLNREHSTWSGLGKLALPVPGFETMRHE